MQHADHMEPLVYIERCLRGEMRTEGSCEWNTSDLTARQGCSVDKSCVTAEPKEKAA